MFNYASTSYYFPLNNEETMSKPAIIVGIACVVLLVLASAAVGVLFATGVFKMPSSPGGGTNNNNNDGGDATRFTGGDIATDVHVLTRTEGTMVAHQQADGTTVEVLTPTELIDSATGKVPLKDFVPGFGAGHRFLKRQFKDGLLTFVWNTKDKPEWAPENPGALKPFSKDTYYFTLHWVRVRGTWFPLLRYDNFGDEKFANDRLVASARVISSWHENMSTMLRTMLQKQGSMKPEFRFSADEIKRIEELLSNKNGWMMENVPTEHFGLGGGTWMGVVFAHIPWLGKDYPEPSGLLLHGIDDLQKFADEHAWIPVHETCHCLCVDPKTCSDDCAPGHSSRFQQLEWLLFNWASQNGHFAKAGNSFAGACYKSTKACNNPQPTWLPVEGNDNGGTLCVDAPGQRRLTPLAKDAFFGS